MHTRHARAEDKWIEFVINEVDQRRRDTPSFGRSRAALCIRRVEVHAGYLWLFGGALLAWFMR